MRQVSDPLVGTIDVPGFPIRFSDAPPELELTAPALGEANTYVLGELLGYDDATLAELTSAGVIFEKDR